MPHVDFCTSMQMVFFIAVFTTHHTAPAYTTARTFILVFGEIWSIGYQVLNISEFQSPAVVTKPVRVAIVA